MTTLDDYARMPVWVRWKMAPHPKTGKLVKTPFRLDRVERGWKNGHGRGTRAEAEAAASRGEWSGVGTVLGEPTKAAGTILCGLDIDTCLDDLADVRPWARPTIDDFATRTEISPSGGGVKLYFAVRLVDLPAIEKAIETAGRQTWKQGTSGHPPGFELYLRDRWFAVTDELLPGTTPEVRVIPLATLLTLIQKTGPAFAGRKTSGRSEHSMSIGRRAKRNGASPEEVAEAIAADEIGAVWMADHDQRQIDRVYQRSGHNTGQGAELGDMKGFGLNEDDMALRFKVKYGRELRYDHDSGLWHRWSGVHWRPNRNKLAFEWSRQLNRAIRLKNAGDKGAAMLAKVRTAQAVETFAQADRAFAVNSDEWDRDPWLLGTPGGTVDLRTGEMRTARQEDMISKITAVAPAADYLHPLDCPRWSKFLEEITSKNTGLIRFLQQWAGYSLTGDITEEALLFLLGPGMNGKTVFVNTVRNIVGDYGLVAPPELLSASKFDRHPEELARLRGARIVTMSETEQGRAWAEVRIKNLTGGERITARFLNKSFFEFQPECKLLISGNNKPRIRGVDRAMRRRINLAEFKFVPPQPDPDLESKLKEEWPEILAWMITGCLDWQANRLVRPKVMIDATEKYFTEQDLIQQWIDQCCELGKGFEDNRSALYQSYEVFMRDIGETVEVQSTFYDELEKRGHTQRRVANMRLFRGLKLIGEDFEL